MINLWGIIVSHCRIGWEVKSAHRKPWECFLGASSMWSTLLLDVERKSIPALFKRLAVLNVFPSLKHQIHYSSIIYTFNLFLQLSLGQRTDSMQKLICWLVFPRILKDCLWLVCGSCIITLWCTLLSCWFLVLVVLCQKKGEQNKKGKEIQIKM